jgi:hypothetical protein
MEDEQEHKERPRPRVVDKRVSARGDAPAEPAAPPESDPSRREPPQPIDAAEPPNRSEPASIGEDRDRRDDPTQAPSGGQVWTPQQEEEMRQVAKQIAETPSLEWVVNTAVTLANVAGTKLDLGAVADAQMAIDALAALVNGLGPRLAQAEAPLRQTLAQLQMAYADAVPPPGTVPGT